MRYSYKKVVRYTTILSCSVLIPVQISYGTETQLTSAKADDKTIAVLNDMLATLQQPVKTDEKIDTQVPHNAPIAIQENNIAAAELNANMPIANAVSNEQAESQAPAVINQVLPQQVDEHMATKTPVVSSESIVAEGKEIESLEKEKIDEKVGIDTINLPEPQGNWLYKSIWYERAQELYENIRKLVDTVWDLRTTFLEKRTELDRAVLDPFYISVGLRMGELAEVLGGLVSKFNAERSKDGELNIQERSLLEEIKAEQLLIEGLHAQVKNITELDHRIDEALNKLMDQLSRVRVYERDAWTNFKKISQLLSDTKARELYYAMDIQMRNIKDIQKYLKNEFNPYFKSTVDRITKEIASVQQSVEKLKEQGVDFKTQADVLFQAIVHPVKKEDSIERNEHTPLVEKEIDTKPTFLGRMIKIFNNIIELIVYPAKLLFGKFFRAN